MHLRGLADFFAFTGTPFVPDYFGYDMEVPFSTSIETPMANAGGYYVPVSWSGIDAEFPGGGSGTAIAAAPVLEPRAAAVASGGYTVDPNTGDVRGTTMPSAGGGNTPAAVANGMPSANGTPQTDTLKFLGDLFKSYTDFEKAKIQSNPANRVPVGTRPGVVSSSQTNTLLIMAAAGAFFYAATRGGRGGSRSTYSRARRRRR